MPVEKGSEGIATGAVNASGTKSHVPALDGVRGIAILLVVFYHFENSLEAMGVSRPLLKPFTFGWCGVDVFFALSGFLITGILLDTRSSPNYFKAFYARRILRIFPLYYGALAMTFLLRTAFPGAGIWGSHAGLWSPGSYLWPALFLQNAAIFIRGADATGVLAHYWSLAVEEHFYLFWPLLVWVLSRRWAAIVALGAIGASIGARALLLHRGMDTDPIFGLTPLRMDGLAIGALTAMLVRAYDIHRLIRPAALTLTGAIAILAVLFLSRGSADQSDPAIWIASYPLVSICTAAILVLSCSGGMLARFLSANVLRWFGKYSYGLYVWHPIIGMVLFHSRLSPVPSGAGAGLVVTIALAVFALDLLVAWASFNLWEKRFLDLKRYFPAWDMRPKPAWDTGLLSHTSGP